MKNNIRAIIRLDGAKYMTPVLGAPLLYHVLKAISQAGIDDAAVIMDADFDFNDSAIHRAVCPASLNVVFENKPIKEFKENTLYINAAMCFAGADALHRLIEAHSANDNQITVLEETENSIFCINPDAQSNICYDSLNSYIAQLPENAVGHVSADFGEIYCTQTHSDIAKTASALQKAINEKHIANGVIIINPDSTYIGPDCEISAGTVIYPNNYIEGNTKIGKGCEIGPNNRIKDCCIGNKTNIQYSVADKSEIGDETSVGPFAYIRPGSKIGSLAKIGDFVEIKNSTLGDNTKVSHLTYIGDSDVGSNINFGCGTVTVNYDGKNKYRTVIEDDVFIGCNSNLVAPVTIKKGSYVAAGSTITDDVPESSLAIARARQIIKEGWVRPYNK